MKTSQGTAKAQHPKAASGQDEGSDTSSAEPLRVEDDLGEIRHAYALVESRSRPGNFYALHLTGVIAEKLETIGNNGNPTHPNFASQRMLTAINIRYERRGWNKP